MKKQFFPSCKKIISIEGNIGSGKSTFLKKIFNDIDCTIVFEPHQKWQNIEGNNLLDCFYKDMKRWAYSFQNYVFLTRIQTIEKAIQEDNNNIFICERSVLADRYTFAKACYKFGYINDLEWSIYCSWFFWMTEKYAKLPDMIIYLKVSPETSYKRIHKRNRCEENNINMEYISLLNSYHDDWLLYKKDILSFIDNIPILVLDCNEDFEHNSNKWNLLTKQICEFIEIYL